MENEFPTPSKPCLSTLILFGVVLHRVQGHGITLLTNWSLARNHNVCMKVIKYIFSLYESDMKYLISKFSSSLASQL